MKSFINYFQKNKKVIYFILITCLVILAIFPRSVELINNNYIFVQDQGRDYVEIKKLVENKKLTLIGSEIGGGYAGINGIFQGPFHFYMLSIFYILFNQDPYGGIVYMFVFGIASILAAFYIGKKIFNNNVYGLIFAILIAASPPLIAQSRFVWNPYPATIFILASFYFTYKMKERKLIYIFLSTFFAAFIYHFELAVTAPLLISLFLYVLFILKFKKIKEYFIFFLGPLIALTPMIIFEVRHNFLGVNGLIKYIKTPTSANDSYGFINFQYQKFIEFFQNTFPSQNIIPGLIILIILLITLIYYFRKEKQQEIKNIIKFFFILIIVTVIIFSFLRNILFQYYFYDLSIVYLFFFTYIIYSSWKSKNKIPAYIISAIFLITVVLAIYSGIITFKKDINDYGGTSKIQSKKDVVDYIYNDAKTKNFGVLVFTPGVLTEQFDYVFNWYGKNKYGFTPHYNKEGLFYLIINPDPYAPWSYKGWLETVIKDGKILETKTLPSGLIIQKRCLNNCPI